MRVFFDTSAFVKRYVEEPDSGRVLALCSQAANLGVSVILLPELVSTLRRLVRDARLTEPDYARLKSAALRDLRDADLCDLTPAVLERTVGCLERNPLRAMDAIHLGSAIVYRPDLFVTADRRQLEAARKEGLAVEDLGASP
jgi:hypothetical protein